VRLQNEVLLEELEFTVVADDVSDVPPAIRQLPELCPVRED